LALVSVLPLPVMDRSSSFNNECNDDGGMAAIGGGLLAIACFLFLSDRKSFFSSFSREVNVPGGLFVKRVGDE
jgi:hypothetical protein